MSVSLGVNGAADVRVVAGESLALRIAAYDPNGISKIFVQCFQFSMASSSKTKLAVGEVSVSPEHSCSQTSFDVTIPIPENAGPREMGRAVDRVYESARVQVVVLSGPRKVRQSCIRSSAASEQRG